MRRLKAVLVTSPQWDQSHKWALFLLMAFTAKYLYILFPAAAFDKNFYPWRDDVPLMDWRNYVYLIGERFFIMVLFYIISRLMYCWQTLLIWLLTTGYIVDFLLTFHSSRYGAVMMSIIGLLFISKLIPWSKLFSKISGSLFSSFR
jgi:hypothetical protein